jgi:hypothetical protein
VDRIAIIVAGRGRDVKRLQQEREQQNFLNRDHGSSSEISTLIGILLEQVKVILWRPVDGFAALI